MKTVSFLQKNLKWSAHKNFFDNLLAPAVEEKILVRQLQDLSERYFPRRKCVETAYTEFCLNRLFLKKARTPEQLWVTERLAGQWEKFCLIKEKLQGVLLPADEKSTRIEQIADVVCRCTQCADKEFADFSAFDFEGNEDKYLPFAMSLAEINFFCAAAEGIFENKLFAAEKLAKTFVSKPLKAPFVQGQLRHCGYCNGTLTANVDSLGNSAVKFGVVMHTSVGTEIYCGGRNVFDTFCKSRFGEKTADFLSETPDLAVRMQYFLQNNCEVRRYEVTNRGKKRTLTFDVTLKNTSAMTGQYFETEGALCLASEECYCAVAVVEDERKIKCPFEEGRLSFRRTVACGETICFAVVTAYANMPDLAESILKLDRYGETRCPVLCDRENAHVVRLDVPQPNCSRGCQSRALCAKGKLHFCFQLGDNDVATFADGEGNTATLIRGFAFGTGGEKIYRICAGKAANIQGNFLLEDGGLTHSGNGYVCRISHAHGKNYDVTYSSPQKTLFYFPLEEKSRVSYKEGKFTVESPSRKFFLRFDGVESYTTNAVECNERRLRTKLSGDVRCGTCLAVCLRAAKKVTAEITSAEQTPAPQPMLRESLVSTYLNYHNNKNVFCISNFLKRADSLSLAAICFTNAQFVEKLLTEGIPCFFYDSNGAKTEYRDKMAFPLAAVYLASLGRCSEQWKSTAQSILLKDTFEGKALCIKALALKKAVKIKGFDKIACLREYDKAKEKILKDKLHCYAQAIGAIPMASPSKQRLKDLCRTYGVPQCWYYVSQLENLYGMSLAEGALKFSPRVSQDNVLEKLALWVDGKRIDASFTKANVQSMTLNGRQYFAPFRPQNLKGEVNTLEVKY